MKMSLGRTEWAYQSGARIFGASWGGMVRSQASKRGIRLLPCFISLFLLWLGCGVKEPPIPFDLIVPKPVGDLAVLVREGRVILHWSLPRENTDGSDLVDLVGFKVLRESLEGEECRGCPERLVPVGEVVLGSGEGHWTEGGRVFWADRGLRAGKRYRYRVVAFNRRGHLGQESNAVEAQWDIPPPPPGKLQASAGDGMVELRWPGVGGATGYNLYRGQKAEGFPLNPVNPKPIENTHYRDTGVVNDREYRYTVRSVSRAGESLIEGRNSATIIAAPVDLIAPSPPTGLVTFPLPEGLELGWNANPEPDILGYHVYRRRVFEPEFDRLTDEMVRDTVYVDGDVQREEEYDYAVTAIDSSRYQNESAFSELVRVRYTFIR